MGSLVKCPQCAQVGEVTEAKCPACGAALSYADLVQPQGQTAAQQPSRDEPLGRLVPYKNAPALIAYYCGVFAIIPVIGVLPAVVALVFGFKGLRCAKEHPEAHGKTHAWVGIVLGTLVLVAHGAVLVLALIANSPHR